jgi:hypothetical protein
MGFPMAQGFRFAKPMPADEFAELLLSRAGRTNEYCGQRP